MHSNSPWEQRRPDLVDIDYLAMWYVLETDEYDDRIETFAKLQDRPPNRDEWGAMNQHALLCRKVIEHIFPGSDWHFERFHHWNRSDMKRKLYGTEIYALCQRMKLRLAR